MSINAIQLRRLFRNTALVLAGSSLQSSEEIYLNYEAGGLHFDGS